MHINRCGKVIFIAVLGAPTFLSLSCADQEAIADLPPNQSYVVLGPHTIGQLKDLNQQMNREIQGGTAAAEYAVLERSARQSHNLLSTGSPVLGDPVAGLPVIPGLSKVQASGPTSPAALANSLDNIPIAKIPQATALSKWKFILGLIMADIGLLGIVGLAMHQESNYDGKLRNAVNYEIFGGILLVGSALIWRSRHK